MRSAFSSVLQCTFVRHQSLPSYLNTRNNNTFLWPNKVHKLIFYDFCFYYFRWFLITLQSPKHSNLFRVYSFEIPQSKHVIRSRPLVEYIYRRRREHAYSPYMPSVRRLLWWLCGKITHARNACCSRLLQSVTVLQIYATPLRSAKHQLLARAHSRFDWLSKKLTSGFQPVLFNLQMLFFLVFFSIQQSAVGFPAALIRLYFSPISVLTLSLTKTSRNNRKDAREKLNKSLMNYQQGRKLITHSTLYSSLDFFPLWSDFSKRADILASLHSAWTFFRQQKTSFPTHHW